MTPREAFRLGFLRRCAEAGLDAAGIEKLAQQGLASVKAANETAGSSWPGLTGAAKGLGGAFTSAGRAALSGAGTLGQYGLYGLLLGPPALGAAAGYGLAQATDIDDEDVDSVKQQELIDEYRRSAAQLRHRNRSFRMASPPASLRRK